MVDSLTIAAARFKIPQGWKIHWDHVSHGSIIDPAIKFESLLCLTHERDFVLDFGWCLRDEGIRFDLQINRGHFGLSDVVIAESWFQLDPALEALQSWLDRIASDTGRFSSASTE